MTVEYQRVVGAWRVTDYDSRLDVDALPETAPVAGWVYFTPAGADRAGRVWLPVPADPPAAGFLLAVDSVAVEVVDGRLAPVSLPAVVGGVPVEWVARPELWTAPGRGVAGTVRVRADALSWSPPAPDVNGDRVVDLGAMEVE